VLLNYHIGPVLSSLCVGDLVWLVLSGALFAGFSLQNEQAPDDGYINVRNMLST